MARVRLDNQAMDQLLVRGYQYGELGKEPVWQAGDWEVTDQSQRSFTTLNRSGA
jgi:hypothetical protein